MGDLPTDKLNRPQTDPIPKILRAIVIDNPFDDMVPRALKTESKLATEDPNPKPTLSKRSAIKNKQLISFADEYDDEDDFRDKPKIKSLYDVQSKQQDGIDEN